MHEQKQPRISDKAWGVVRRPSVTLAILGGWSLITVTSQVLVNSGVFLDIHEQQLDGALGGLAFSFSALPLAAAYFYCLRSPQRHPEIFWLAAAHQGAMFVAALYHWAIGTFSIESIVIPVVASGTLTVLSFLQFFEPRGAGVQGSRMNSGEAA